MDDLVAEGLAKRLSLYQVFLRLYENNTALIDDILQLEDNYQPINKEFTQLYVQGIVDELEVCIITNLSTGKTQKLLQQQGIWTIGRNSSNGICVIDPCLSNFHGAIQYFLEERNFYLIDFNSTNGSYVNGEPIYQPTRLKDGDRVRLGKLSFSFFVNDSVNVLPRVPGDLLTQLKSPSSNINSNHNEILTDVESTVGLLKKSQKIESLDIQDYSDSIYQQRSDILDKFFSQKNAQEKKCRHKISANNFTDFAPSNDNYNLAPIVNDFD